MLTYITEHIPTLITTVGAALAWIFERRKRKLNERKMSAETTKEELKRNQELWKNKYRRLKAEFENYKAKHEN